MRRRNVLSSMTLKPFDVDALSANIHYVVDALYRSLPSSGSVLYVYIHEN